jgi:hypothetical protein
LGDTLVLLGVVCFLAAIVGGGLEVSNVAKIPLLGSRPRQLALGAAGLALAGAGWIIRTSTFNVTGATVTSDSIVVFFCPETVTYTAVIRASGDQGTVEYRFIHNSLPMKSYSLPFNGQTARTVSVDVTVNKPLAGFNFDDDMAIEILTPNGFKSSTATTDVRC